MTPKESFVFCPTHHMCAGLLLCCIFNGFVVLPVTNPSNSACAFFWVEGKYFFFSFVIFPILLVFCWILCFFLALLLQLIVVLLCRVSLQYAAFFIWYSLSYIRLILVFHFFAMWKWWGFLSTLVLFSPFLQGPLLHFTVLPPLTYLTLAPHCPCSFPISSIYLTHLLLPCFP